MPGASSRVRGDFTVIELFEWEGTTVFPDQRKDYKEERLVAYGRITGRLHCLVFTVESDHIHLISLRKANKKEVKRYGQKTNTADRKGR
jgi:uncharacterized DUF497 family protein